MQTFARADQGEILERLRQIEAVQNKHIFEREDVTRAITICLIVRGHLLLTGPPGVAKTTQIRLAAAHVRGESVLSHSALALFDGRGSLWPRRSASVQEKGSAGAGAAGMLQEADVAVIDEIYNGNEAVLKALLAPMNEGVSTPKPAAFIPSHSHPHGHDQRDSRSCRAAGERA